MDKQTDIKYAKKYNGTQEVGNIVCDLHSKRILKSY